MRSWNYKRPRQHQTVLKINASPLRPRPSITSIVAQLTCPTTKTPCNYGTNLRKSSIWQIALTISPLHFVRFPPICTSLHSSAFMLSASRTVHLHIPVDMAGLGAYNIRHEISMVGHQSFPCQKWASIFICSNWLVVQLRLSVTMWMEWDESKKKLAMTIYSFNLLTVLIPGSSSTGHQSVPQLWPAIQEVKVIPLLHGHQSFISYCDAFRIQLTWSGRAPSTHC